MGQSNETHVLNKIFQRNITLALENRIKSNQELLSSTNTNITVVKENWKKITQVYITYKIVKPINLNTQYIS